MKILLRSLLPVLCAALVIPRELRSEWGAEASLGSNPTSYYSEELKKEQSQYRNQVSGRRHALSFTGKLHYEWIGLRFWMDYYFPGTGKQKLQYSVPSGMSQNFVNSETEGGAYSNAATYRTELQLRKFRYGHREVFTFNSGLLYRIVTTDLSGQPADYAPQSVTSRYLTLGITFEPLLAYFGRYELSMPLDFSLGLKFPEGGVFDGGGPGAVMLAGGLRLQLEPRGVFVTGQGMLHFFETGYATHNAKYSFQQLEVTVRLAAGYYFRSPVYNE